MSTQIGVESLAYAIMTSEGVYAAPVAIAPAIKVAIKPKVNTATLYGDNSAQEVVSMVGEIGLDIETTYLTLAVQAALLGHSFNAVTGIITHKNDDVAPYVAIGFKAKKSNGKYRFVWLLKGKFEPVSEDFETMEDKVKFNTPKITATFVTRVDGNYKYTADEDEGTVTSTFLNTVYSPTIDLVAPTFTSVPVDDEAAASKTADIVVIFNKPMDTTTVNGSTLFLKTDDGAAVALVMAWDVAREVVTCSHAALVGATLYNLIITTGIKSVDQVSIAANVVQSFTTVN